MTDQKYFINIGYQDKQYYVSENNERLVALLADATKRGGLFKLDHDAGTTFLALGPGIPLSVGLTEVDPD